MRGSVCDCVCLRACGSVWVCMSPPVSGSEIWDTRSVWQKLLEELPRLRHESLIMKPPDSWSKREREGWKGREEWWEEDRGGGGAMELDANCQLCFNSEYVCILQQNKEWGVRKRERGKSEGRQLKSKPAHIVMWMTKAGTDESWRGMSWRMKGKEMKAEWSVFLMIILIIQSCLYYSGLF